MAILRGGKRIGGHDIRIGMPRDRSLDNVYKDPRLKRTMGGNPETTIGRFQSYVNEAEGFARSARYYAEFQLPRGIPSGRQDSGLGAQPTNDPEEKLGFSTQTDNMATQISDGRRVRAFCSAIQMPDREIITKEVKHNGPARKVAYDFKSGDISATFYADKFMRERSYFELWQKAAFSTANFNYNFYNDYVTPLNIFQLGQFASRQERDDVTYGVQLLDAFPKTISAVDYSAEANSVQTFTVTFTFRYWVNYFIDQQGNIELGSPSFGKPTVKKGPFGGILKLLPPELRRAGRDVLNDLRRRVPLGRVTGGRVFPPFKIPPLNI
tara:strand:+ start:94 stop:1065 length:972 start_codon:yes stop_codon:yes gene_type:complete